MTLTSDYAFENSFRKRFRSFVRAGLCWITGIDMHKRRSRRPRLPLGVILADTDGADADDHRVDRARQWCASSRLASPLIHCESPVRVATLPSSVIADLNSTHGRPTRACLRNAWLSSRALAASSPSASTTSTPSSRRIPRPRPEAFSVGIVRADDHAPDPGLQDRVGARRRLALVTAGLQRHVQRRAAQVLQAARLDRVDLGVGAPKTLVPALAEHLAVARDHRADDRVGLDRARRRCARARSRAPGAPCRCRCMSASTRITLASALRAAPAVQAIDGHLRPRPAVGERVVVEAPVEVERDRPVAARVRRGAVDDFALARQRAVVGERPRHRARVGERAAGLRGAAHHPAVAVRLVVADQRRRERALVVLDPDLALRAASAPAARSARAAMDTCSSESVGAVACRAPSCAHPSGETGSTTIARAAPGRARASTRASGCACPRATSDHARVDAVDQPLRQQQRRERSARRGDAPRAAAGAAPSQRRASGPSREDAASRHRIGKIGSSQRPK